jgi:hypothetical protein
MLFAFTSRTAALVGSTLTTVLDALLWYASVSLCFKACK